MFNINTKIGEGSCISNNSVGALEPPHKVTAISFLHPRRFKARQPEILQGKNKHLLEFFFFRLLKYFFSRRDPVFTGVYQQRGPAAAPSTAGSGAAAGQRPGEGGGAAAGEAQGRTPGRAGPSCRQQGRAVPPLGHPRPRKRNRQPNRPAPPTARERQRGHRDRMRHRSAPSKAASPGGPSPPQGDPGRPRPTWYSSSSEASLRMGW